MSRKKSSQDAKGSPKPNGVRKCTERPKMSTMEKFRQGIFGMIVAGIMAAANAANALAGTVASQEIEITVKQFGAEAASDLMPAGLEEEMINFAERFKAPGEG